MALVALGQVRLSLKKLVSVRAESLTYALRLGVVNPVREDCIAKLKKFLFLLVNVERAGHLVVVGKDLEVLVAPARQR